MPGSVQRGIPRFDDVFGNCVVETEGKRLHEVRLIEVGEITS